MSAASTIKPMLTINERRIGTGEPVYIIAEMSANHGQDFEQARAIVHAAKAAGADAVKAANTFARCHHAGLRQPLLSNRRRQSMGRTPLV